MILSLPSGLYTVSGSIGHTNANHIWTRFFVNYDNFGPQMGKYNEIELNTFRTVIVEYSWGLIDLEEQWP